jgi:polar amino acid transport system substrate-binding protein
MTQETPIVKSQAPFFARGLAVALLLAGWLIAPVSAQDASSQQPAQQPADQPKAELPGDAYADPEGIPLRSPTPDIAPVYKGPAVDMLATIRQRGTLRVGVAWAEPMVMHDAEGNLLGFSIDLGRKLADDLGVEVEFVQTSWTQIIPDLIDNHFDVIASGLWVTPERALVVNYTNPTTVEAVHLIAGKPLASGMKTREEFNRPDVKITVYAGTVQESVAKRYFPNAQIIITSGEDNPLTPVLDGKAHAFLIATLAPLAVVQQDPEKLFLPKDSGLQPTAAAMAIRKGDPDFLNYLNSWLAFHKDDGWLDERLKYWGESTDWLTGM